MATPPPKDQGRRMLSGLQPNGPLVEGSSTNHTWTFRVLLALFHRNPGYLDPGPLFGPKGICGGELLGYVESYLGPAIMALILAEREGWAEVAQALRERVEDFFCLYAVHRTGPYPGLLVHPGGRQGWVVISPDGTVTEDNTSSLSAGIQMAITGKPAGPDRSRRWWDHSDHTIAWGLWTLREEGHPIPRVPGDWQSQVERARRVGLYSPMVYVRHERGWRSHTPSPPRYHDNPGFAVAGRIGGPARLLTPVHGEPAWLETTPVVREIPGGYRAEVRVVRGLATSDVSHEDWTGKIQWDDLGLGAELGRWTFADDGRRPPWTFHDAELPLVDPTRGGGQRNPDPEPPVPRREEWLVSPASISPKLFIRSVPEPLVLPILEAVDVLAANARSGDDVGELDLSRLLRTQKTRSRYHQVLAAHALLDQARSGRHPGALDLGPLDRAVWALQDHLGAKG